MVGRYFELESGFPHGRSSDLQGASICKLLHLMVSFSQGKFWSG
jgi:hypothetical protein